MNIPDVGIVNNGVCVVKAETICEMIGIGQTYYQEKKTSQEEETLFIIHSVL